MLSMTLHHLLQLLCSTRKLCMEWEWVLVSGHSLADTGCNLSWWNVQMGPRGDQEINDVKIPVRMFPSNLFLTIHQHMHTRANRHTCAHTHTHTCAWQLHTVESVRNCQSCVLMIRSWEDSQPCLYVLQLQLDAVAWDQRSPQHSSLPPPEGRNKHYSGQVSKGQLS